MAHITLKYSCHFILQEKSIVFIYNLMDKYLFIYFHNEFTYPKRLDPIINILKVLTSCSANSNPNVSQILITYPKHTYKPKRHFENPNLGILDNLDRSLRF